MGRGQLENQEFPITQFPVTHIMDPGAQGALKNISATGVAAVVFNIP